MPIARCHRDSATITDTGRVIRAARLVLALLTGTMWAVGTARAADDTALRLANVDATNTSYVRIPNSAAFALQQFTIEAWVQRVGPGYGFSTDAAGAAVVAKPAEGTLGSFLGSWYLVWNNSGQAYFSVTHTLGVNGVELQAPAVATPLARHHLAAVVATDSVRVYVDGALAAAAPWTLGTVYVGSEDVLIGACNFGVGYLRRLDGVIDDVRIWDHARTQAQISASMNCRLTGSEPGLVAYYRFDASSLADDTGHGHAGAAVATTGSLSFTPLAVLSDCVADVAPGGRPLIPTLTVSPQPTRGPSRMRFTLPVAGRAAISVYDVAGRRCMTLAAGRYEPGEYVVEGDLSRADGGHPVAGVRFVRLEYGNQRVTRTIVVMP
jgi:hypothetical protein